MNLGSLIPALVFGILALAIILYSLKNLFSPFFPKIKNFNFSFKPLEWKELSLYKKRVKTLYTFDAYVVANKQGEALSALSSSFILDHIRGSKALLERVRIHNLEALNRLITLAKKSRSTIKNIAVIEELLDNRNKLLYSYFDSKTLRDNIKRKAGQASAQNSKEFNKQLESLRSEIFNNKNALRAELQKAFSELNEPSSSSEITYH